jgi:hypothetical protein
MQTSASSESEHMTKLIERFRAFESQPQSKSADDVFALLSDSRAYVEAVQKSGQVTSEFKAHALNMRLYFLEILMRMPHLSQSEHAKLRAEVEKLPSEVQHGKYHFTADWFHRNEVLWRKIMDPMVGKPDLNFLEIGSYEGMSAVWVLDNVLTHDTARLTCIDKFIDYRWGWMQIKGDEVRARFKDNIAKSGAGHKVTLVESFSQEVLRTFPLNSFDFIYVGASHRACDALEDMVLCWRLLKVGGGMIIEDYGKPFPSPKDGPKPAYDAFSEIFADQIETVAKDFQVFIRKLAS